jgi:hypothetical protein
MKKITVSYIIDGTDNGSDYEFRCSMNATKMNGAIWDALQAIRARIKYCDDVSEAELDCLENLRSMLSEAYTEE